MVLEKKRETYGKWDKEESHKRAKQVVVSCLIKTGDVGAALKAVESTHPTIKVPRQTQTALSWLKKIQDTRNKANKQDDAADMLANQIMVH
jgi:predicted ATPase